MRSSISSQETHGYRPAGAGMMVPVMVQRREHEEPQDYRFAADEVNPGTEAFPSRVRFSLTP
jgi:hypothetical protein